MQPDPDPLPPLAEVFNARADGYINLYSDKYRIDRAQIDGKALEAEAAAEIAAPYDAKIQRLEQRVAELEARLAKFEELAKDVADCRWKETDDLPRGFDGWITGMYEEDFRNICSELAALAEKEKQ